MSVAHIYIWATGSTQSGPSFTSLFTKQKALQVGLANVRCALSKVFLCPRSRLPLVTLTKALLPHLNVGLGVPAKVS